MAVAARARTVAAYGVPIAFAAGVEPPGLQPAADGADAPTVVELAPLDPAWENATTERTRELRGRDGEALLWVDYAPGLGYRLTAPEHGRFEVSADGLRVACEPGGELWEPLLTAQVLPLVATVRGFELLHAGAVGLGEGAVLVAGPSGAGKSTQTLALVAAGGELLGDDAVALDPRGDRLVAHPSPALIHVAPEEFARAGQGAQEVGRRLGKLSLTGRRASRPLPLAALFLLSPERAETTAIEPLASPDPMALLSATFNLSVRTPERLHRHLELCARLAAEVPVFSVRAEMGDPAATAAEIARRAW